MMVHLSAMHSLIELNNSVSVQMHVSLVNVWHAESGILSARQANYSKPSSALGDLRPGLAGLFVLRKAVSGPPAPAG